MAISLYLPGPEMTVLVLGRNRRSFTERDREMLNLIRPHLAEAYRNARRIDRLRQRIDAQVSMPRHAELELDAHGRIVKIAMAMKETTGIKILIDLTSSRSDG
jgi:hypothetical protein